MQIIVVVIGDDRVADDLYTAAIAPFALTKSVLRYKHAQVTPRNLPPALAETIPQLPGLKENKSMAVICSGFACQPPIYSATELTAVTQKILKGQ